MKILFLILFIFIFAYNSFSKNIIISNYIENIDIISVNDILNDEKMKKSYSSIDVVIEKFNLCYKCYKCNYCDSELLGIIMAGYIIQASVSFDKIIDNKNAISYLKKIIERNKNKSYHAMSYLAVLDEKETLEYISKFLNSTDNDIFETAVWSLSTMCNSGGKKVLLNFCLSTNDITRRNFILEVIKKFDCDKM